MSNHINKTGYNLSSLWIVTVQVIEILSQFKYMLAVTWPYTDRKGLTFTLDQYNSSMQIIFPFKDRDLGYLKDVEEIHQRKSKIRQLLSNSRIV